MRKMVSSKIAFNTRRQISLLPQRYSDSDLYCTITCVSGMCGTSRVLDEWHVLDEWFVGALVLLELFLTQWGADRDISLQIEKVRCELDQALELYQCDWKRERCASRTGGRDRGRRTWWRRVGGRELEGEDGKVRAWMWREEIRKNNR